MVGASGSVAEKNWDCFFGLGSDGIFQRKKKPMEITRTQKERKKISLLERDFVLVGEEEESLRDI